MIELRIARLSPEDAPALSRLLNDPEYRKYFTPFAVDAQSLEARLASAREDRYWGLWLDQALAGFCMLRGFDEGFQRPSFGVYIARCHAGKGLSGCALHHCMSWCQVNGVPSLMLKVHPDNRYAQRSYEKAGFSEQGSCPRTGHTIMEKSWSRG